jgi:hypothetical protein
MARAGFVAQRRRIQCQLPPEGNSRLRRRRRYSAIGIVAKVANCEPHEAMRLPCDKLGLCDPEPVEFNLRKTARASRPSEEELVAANGPRAPFMPERFWRR